MEVFHASTQEILHPDILHSRKYLDGQMSDFQKQHRVMTTHDEGYYAILDAKYARIIKAISQMHNISLDEAMEMFYTSDLLQLMNEGVADLHCRSDRYLAEEVWNEKHEL